MQLSLNSKEKSRFFAKREPSKLSESFLVAGVTYGEGKSAAISKLELFLTELSDN